MCEQWGGRRCVSGGGEEACEWWGGGRCVSGGGGGV